MGLGCDSPGESLFGQVEQARSGDHSAAPYCDGVSAGGRGAQSPRATRRAGAVAGSSAAAGNSNCRVQAAIKLAPGIPAQVRRLYVAYLNSNYLKLKSGYLFPEIARRVARFCEQNSEAAKRLIRCGIGDVTEPLPGAAIAALHKAVDEMGQRETFRGYGPEQGYEFVRQAIEHNDYRARGLEVADDEIFISDGSKCDGGN